MVDMQCATAETRRGKKKEEERKKKIPEDENIIACPITYLLHRAAMKRE